ncbi:hypothetical protein [Bradyrhizobium vignae]|uniref:Tetratricopeptide repeat protein n=1 Tax=Bradyrhizobium vignae TaxID=1549949 RepID=A0A2U3PW34_9BRAD|nr:hypothetical protein [Bradyrhizobium vignae]MBP0111776.1 hypothetical protein [Bradyrhizobium vignae]SPP93344.1 protein of unknown function [Bradyrhizobium vignae]
MQLNLALADYQEAYRLDPADAQAREELETLKDVSGVRFQRFQYQGVCDDRILRRLVH